MKYFFFLPFFSGRVSLHSPGWPWPFSPIASASCKMGSQVHATTPAELFLCGGCHFAIFPCFISSLVDTDLTNPLPVLIPYLMAWVLLHATVLHDRNKPILQYYQCSALCSIFIPISEDSNKLTALPFLFYRQKILRLRKVKNLQTLPWVPKELAGAAFCGLLSLLWPLTSTRETEEYMTQP